MSEDIQTHILPVAPAIADLIMEKTQDARIAAARKLQDPVVQTRLLRTTNLYYGPGQQGGSSATEKILACVFRLNPTFAVRYLCQEVIGSRRASREYDWKIFAPTYLGLLADERALPYLAAQAINGIHPRERFAAIRSIRAFASPWAGEILVDIFQETEAAVLKQSVIPAIAGINTDDTVRFLRYLVNTTTDIDLQEICLFSLVRAGDKEIIERLLTIIEQNQDIQGAENKTSQWSITRQLWDNLLPNAKFFEKTPDNDIIWFRNALRRTGKYLVSQIMAISPTSSTTRGRFQKNNYSDHDFSYKINPLFDRLTAIPIKEAQQILDAAFPEDEDYARFLIAMSFPFLFYPAMWDILDFDRTYRVISSLSPPKGQTPFPFGPPATDAGLATSRISDIQLKNLSFVQEAI
ncbi:MAG: HEAT repeat domain-containing protein [Candidatus Omnitrophota bacterium]